MKRLFFVFLTCSLLFLTACSAEGDDPSLYIDILDVGKADCIIIRHRNQTVMIDTAEAENLTEVLAFLNSKKITNIDTLIISHFDKDHIGGAEGILKVTEIDRVIESNFSSDRGEYYIYHGVLREQEKEPIRITEPYSFTVGECTFNVFPPEQDQYEEKQDNNASLIVTLQYRQQHFAFFGDALDDRMNEFVAVNTQKFDFVKLPHHGSYLENYPEILQNLKCQYAAITCSKKNPASQITVEFLNQQNVTCYYTQNGNVSLHSDGKALRITQ